MKRALFILIFLLFQPVKGESIDELVKDEKALESSFRFSNSSLQIVQKRWLDRRFLSELSLAFSHILKGFEHLNSSSISAGYRFFLNNHWSFDLKYSWYFHSITSQGEDEIVRWNRIPLEMRYPKKHSYMGGISWYPLYGKSVFYNHLVYFDLYFSLSMGVIELIRQEKFSPSGSVAMGIVFWLNKNFNARIETQGFYYTYSHSDKGGNPSDIHEYFYKIYISTGVLF